MRLWQTILVYLFLCIGVCWAMRKQGVAVRGVLKCGAVPSNYSKVRIVDIDYGRLLFHIARLEMCSRTALSGPDPDDTLDEKRTDERGRFEVSGTTHEMTPIDPVMYIWHECRDEQTNFYSGGHRNDQSGGGGKVGSPPRWGHE
ncbi:Transthyretin-like family protein [Ancylostoma ceylanicum]|uniref:Transthyretin-like family protein n=1 Tax=Ancylostoma ceylanicum TaxID=53326 RepID=A0A0D6LSG9_9BILA|nr:Transthyretin-like family protein [Ancylostoma ceylanicum]